MINENYSVSFMCLVFLSDFVCCHSPPLGVQCKTFPEALLSFRLRWKNVSTFSPSEVIGLGEIS